MSESPETTDRSLASNPHRTQQPQGSSIQQPTFTFNQPGKIVFSFVEHSAKKPYFKARRHRRHTKPNASLSTHGRSSRPEPQTTASSGNMAFSPAPVNLTKTGRISKAKKGMKVHKCENCGKFYSRAEHLRRHQKNHAQEGTLVCNYLNCDKTFYRIDLLQRHQERHNDTGRSSRQASAFSPEGSPDVPQTSEFESLASPTEATTTPSDPSLYPPQLLSPMHESATPPRYTSSLFRTPQHPRAIQAPTSNFRPFVPFSLHSTSPNQTKHHHSFTGRHLVSVPMAVDGMTPGLSWNDSYSQSPSYASSDGYPSPTPGSSNIFPHMSYCTDPNRTRASSAASFADPWSYMSHSPVSPTSTMAYPWASSEKTSTAPNYAYTSTPYPITSAPLMVYDQFGPKPMMQRDDEESIMLFGEQPYGTGPTTHAYPFEQDLDYYWRLFHPTYPIVHRPSFRRLTLSPMLHAAMIAIGGQYSGDTAFKRKSMILHDRCLELLERREHYAMLEPERLQDYQATFLIEIFSLFRARRSLKSLSSHFIKAYHKSFVEFKRRASSLENASNQWEQWIELVSWQRLLQACYILESQQALLLAREPMPSLIQDTGYDLPFPAPLSVWDADTHSEWIVACQQYPRMFQTMYEVNVNSLTTNFDTFQSSFFLSAHYNRFDAVTPYSTHPPVLTLEHHLKLSPATLRLHMTVKLIHVTPIRALLAVAGESWIFSEKASLATLVAFKKTLRTWVMQLWAPNDSTQLHDAPVSQAVALSVEIVQSALMEQADCLIPEVGTDLGIYFATLVLWIVIMAATAKVQVECEELHPFSDAQQQSSCSLLDISKTKDDESLLLALANDPRSPAIQSQTHITSTYVTCASPGQIKLTVTSFLSSVLQDCVAGYLNADDITRCQTGCTNLLLWAQFRVRGTWFVEGVLPSGDGIQGELLGSISTMLERLVEQGWTGGGSMGWIDVI